MELFTYGSLMFPEVWRRVTGQDCDSVPAIADGYSVRRVRGVPWPMMIPAAGDTARGRLYQDVSAESMARLDRFEGPDYRRLELTVRTGDGRSAPASAYVAALPGSPDILGDPWDPDAFERDDLPAFLATFLPPGANR